MRSAYRIIVDPTDQVIAQLLGAFEELDVPDVEQIKCSANIYNLRNIDCL